MNKIVLTGRPTKDPEIVHYNAENGDDALARFSFAVKKMHSKGGRTADFFNCVAFGRQEKIVEKHVKKGIKLLITGRMENNDYEVDGIKVYGYQLVIESIEFLDKKDENTAPVMEDENGFMTISEEEMPFK